MRSVLYIFTAAAVMALAFWTYRESFRTQAQINEMTRVQREIAGLREELGVLRAEWAFLNRPERLRELVNLNFDRLQLLPFTADQFVAVGAVGFPPPPEPEPDPETQSEPEQENAP